MAPSKIKSNSWSHLKGLANLEQLGKLLADPHHIAPICSILLVFELAVNILIIEWVKYTEIDWIAYMQEVEGFINGTLDYKDLKGEHGTSKFKWLF